MDRSCHASPYRRGMRKRTRRSEHFDPFDALTDLGDKLRQQYGEVRYAEYIFYVNNQWTCKAGWERLENGDWFEIELPLENY